MPRVRMLVRRSFAAALLLALAGVALAAPADAHLCARPVAVEPGEPSSFTVGVPAENVPVVGVTVHIPSGYDVDRVEGAKGWRTERDGDDVHFTGGRIGLVSCGSFEFHGTAAARRTYAFPITIEKSTGEVEELTSIDIGPSSAQLVFAGTEIPEFERSEGSSFPWKLPALVGVVAGIYGAVLWRGHRRAAGAVAAAARKPRMRPKQRAKRPPSTGRKR